VRLPIEMDRVEPPAVEHSAIGRFQT
jgi:hypothetical protein